MDGPAVVRIYKNCGPAVVRIYKNCGPAAARIYGRCVHLQKVCLFFLQRYGFARLLLALGSTAGGWCFSRFVLAPMVRRLFSTVTPEAEKSESSPAQNVGALAGGTGKDSCPTSSSVPVHRCQSGGVQLGISPAQIEDSSAEPGAPVITAPITPPPILETHHRNPVTSPAASAASTGEKPDRSPPTADDVPATLTDEAVVQIPLPPGPIHRTHSADVDIIGSAIIQRSSSYLMGAISAVVDFSFTTTRDKEQSVTAVRSLRNRFLSTDTVSSDLADVSGFSFITAAAPNSTQKRILDEHPSINAAAECGAHSLAQVAGCARCGQQFVQVFLLCGDFSLHGVHASWLYRGGGRSGRNDGGNGGRGSGGLIPSAALKGCG